MQIELYLLQFSSESDVWFLRIRYKLHGTPELVGLIRGERIWTSDILAWSQVRYQTAPHPVYKDHSMKFTTSFLLIVRIVSRLSLGCWLTVSQVLEHSRISQHIVRYFRTTHFWARQRLTFYIFTVFLFRTLATDSVVYLYNRPSPYTLDIYLLTLSSV